MKNFFYAAASLIGAIVGVGIFGIPYVAAQAGFFIALIHIVFLAGAVLLLHLAYAEVIERTFGQHRLTGYAEKYLGKGAKNLIGVAIMGGGLGALLAYIIVGGRFLNLLLPGMPMNEFAWSLLFWGLLSAAIMRGLRLVAREELIMTGLLVLVMTIIFVAGAGAVEARNISGVVLPKAFLPYGVVLFALMGFQAIPEIKALLKVDGRRLRRVVYLGTLVPAVLYIIFAWVVVGVSGAHTSPEAIEGLMPYLGNWLVGVGALFGVLAVATSYLIFGINLKNTLIYDWRTPRLFAGLLVALAPILLYAAGLRAFVEVIGFTGALLGAVSGIIILWIFLRAKKRGDQVPRFNFEPPRVLVYSVGVLLFFGAVYEIIKFII